VWRGVSGSRRCFAELVVWQACHVASSLAVCGVGPGFRATIIFGVELPPVGHLLIAWRFLITPPLFWRKKWSRPFNSAGLRQFLRSVAALCFVSAPPTNVLYVPLTGALIQVINSHLSSINYLWIFPY
jgi:hypothetical protein